MGPCGKQNNKGDICDTLNNKGKKWITEWFFPKTKEENLTFETLWDKFWQMKFFCFFLGQLIIDELSRNLKIQA